MTLASGERAPEEEGLGTSSVFSSESESESDDSDTDMSRRKRRRQDNKKKTKSIKKKGNCPIHRGSNHNEDQCQVLKKLVSGALATQASTQASSSCPIAYTTPRTTSFRPQQRSSTNMCWHCHKVPFTPGHECHEMKQVRAHRAQRIGGNIRSRMNHLSKDISMMQIDESQLDNQA